MKQKSKNDLDSLPLIIQCAYGRAEKSCLEAWLKDQNSDKNPEIIWTMADGETIKIEQVRKAINQLQYAPLRGRERWWVLIQADRLSIPAQNAMLKILEGPPKDTQIALATCYPEKLLPTIHSRCQVVSPHCQASKQSGNNGNDYKIQTDAAWEQELSQIYIDLSSSSASQIFALSQKYKDRVEALRLVDGLIIFANQKTDLKSKVDHLSWLLQARDYLEKNVNVRQVLEHTFFKFAGIIGG